MSRLTTVLFESEKKETDEILGLHFTLNEPAVRCRIARSNAGIPMTEEPRVNTLCFPVEMSLNGTLTCAMNGTSGPFLMERPGKWKAMLAFTEQSMSVTSSAEQTDQGEINACAVFLWFLTMPDKERAKWSVLLSSFVRKTMEPLPVYEIRNRLSLSTFCINWHQSRPVGTFSVCRSAEKHLPL